LSREGGVYSLKEGRGRSLREGGRSLREGGRSLREGGLRVFVEGGRSIVEGGKRSLVEGGRRSLIEGGGCSLREGGGRSSTYKLDLIDVVGMNDKLKKREVEQSWHLSLKRLSNFKHWQLFGSMLGLDTSYRTKGLH
jgi:hypothetical protein